MACRDYWKSSGIGFAPAIALARAGHTVFAGTRKLDKAAELQRTAANKDDLPISVGKLVDSDHSVQDTCAQILRERRYFDQQRWKLSPFNVRVALSNWV